MNTIMNNNTSNNMIFIHNNLYKKKIYIIQSLWLIKENFTFIDKLLFNVNKKSFKEVKSIILNKEFINKTHKFFNNIKIYLDNTYPNYQQNTITYEFIKTFLTYPLILFHSKDVVGKIDKSNKINMNLLRGARDVYQSINSLRNNPINKHNLFELYINTIKYLDFFRKWKENDKYDLINNLTRNYWEIELVIRQDFKDQPDNGAHIIKEMKKQQNIILNNIQKIDNINGMKQFNSYIPIVYTDEFIDRLRDILEIAYWDIIREELISNKYDKFKSILEELRDMIKYLCGNNNELNQKLSEFFDIELLIQMISNKSYSVSQLLNFNSLLFDF